MFLDDELSYYLLGCAFPQNRLMSGVSITTVILDVVYVNTEEEYVYVVPVTPMQPSDLLAFEQFCCVYFFS